MEGIGVGIYSRGASENREARLQEILSDLGDPRKDSDKVYRNLRGTEWTKDEQVVKAALKAGVDIQLILDCVRPKNVKQYILPLIKQGFVDIAQLDQVKDENNDYVKYDPEIVRAGVEVDGEQLFFAPLLFKADLETVLIALRQNIKAYRHVSQTLKESPKFAFAVTRLVKEELNDNQELKAELLKDYIDVDATWIEMNAEPHPRSRAPVPPPPALHNFVPPSNMTSSNWIQKLKRHQANLMDYLMFCEKHKKTVDRDVIKAGFQCKWKEENFACLKYSEFAEDRDIIHEAASQLVSFETIFKTVNVSHVVPVFDYLFKNDFIDDIAQLKNVRDSRDALLSEMPQIQQAFKTHQASPDNAMSAQVKPQSEESKGAAASPEVPLPDANKDHLWWHDNVRGGIYSLLDYFAWCERNKKKVNLFVITQSIKYGNATNNYQLLKGTEWADNLLVVRDAVIAGVPLQVICNTVSSHKLNEIIIDLVVGGRVSSLDDLRGIKDTSGKVLEDNYDIVMGIVSRNGEELEFASDILKDNIEIVRAAIKNSPAAKKCAGPNARKMLDEEERNGKPVESLKPMLWSLDSSDDEDGPFASPVPASAQTAAPNLMDALQNDDDVEDDVPLRVPRVPAEPQQPSPSRASAATPPQERVGQSAPQSDMNQLLLRVDRRLADIRKVTDRVYGKLDDGKVEPADSIVWEELERSFNIPVDNQKELNGSFEEPVDGQEGPAEQVRRAATPPQTEPVVKTLPFIPQRRIDADELGPYEDEPEAEHTGIFASCYKFIGSCCSGIWGLICSCFNRN